MHARRTTTSFLVIAVATLSLLVPLAAPAGADPVSSKRAEAARLARLLEQQFDRAGQLAEEYDEARLEVARRRAAAAVAELGLRRVQRRIDTTRRSLVAHAVEAYISGGQTADVSRLMGSNAVEVGPARAYLRSLTARGRDALDAMRAAREDSTIHVRAVEVSRALATAAEQRAAGRRRAGDVVLAQHRATLARVRGDLAVLVAAEERRRADVESRRTRAQLRARLARNSRSRHGRASRDESSFDDDDDPVPTSDGVDEPASNPAAAEAVDEIKGHIGKPYRYGASGPDTFDCSGLTSYAWRAAGRSLPHSSRAQYSATQRVDRSDLQPGDLVFFGSPIHHVGMYIGGGRMVHSPQTGKNVRYWTIHRRDYVGAGRVN